MSLGGDSTNNGPGVSRRDFLKLAAAAGTAMAFTPFIDWGKFLPRAKAQLPNGTQTNNNTSPVNATAAGQATDNTAAIRPFHVNVPEAELTELRRRINATRWPSKELVADRSQGVQLATVQALARYWATDYDWRKVEAKLNALPQFTTDIDGVKIHFIHVRSRMRMRCRLS